MDPVLTTEQSAAGPNGVTEPIAALATAVGPAAIAIVRLSGAGCFALARTFLEPFPAALPARRLTRAFVLSASGAPVDEVLVAAFPSPASYTGEDVLEIHCHGGVAVARAIESRVLSAGFRLARPGEFTARAVSCGKMDLLDAEALSALLSADDEGGLEVAQGLRKSNTRLRELGRKARMALVEARGLADYPIETADEPCGWRSRLLALRDEIAALLRLGILEKELQDGVTVALIGPPNAGKSSILNGLTGEARSIVDATPGTTRDAVYAPLLLRGHRVTLIDTAGLRAADGVEGLGVARALAVAEQSSVRIWVEDISAAAVDPPPSLRPELRVLAKADLQPHPSRGAPADGVFLVSAKQGSGLSDLGARLRALAERPKSGLSARPRKGLVRANEILADVDALSDDLAADRLEQAEAVLVQVTGEAISPLEAAEVYAQFCIGK